MSEVPPTVSYADADGYNYYSLNTTCTHSGYLMLTPLDHSLAIILHHIATYITSQFSHHRYCSRQLCHITLISYVLNVQLRSIIVSVRKCIV